MIKKYYVMVLLLVMLGTVSCQKSNIDTPPKESADTPDATTKATDSKSSQENKTNSTSGNGEFVQPEAVKETFTINGHEYTVDAVSGPTKEVPFDKNTPPMDYNEKLKKMFWSGKPAVGTVEGDLYHKEYPFNDGYVAVIDVVKEKGKIVLVELDEIASQSYYARQWAGGPKRLSGYGFFQAESQRTDATLMTLINSMTYLEYQMMSENRLTGDFKTVRGSSNSATKGFIPAAKELAEEMTEPSEQRYHSITKDFGDGISARLLVITNTNGISSVKYDEYFADIQDEIKDQELKQFYRQSKYYSIDYNWVTCKDFKHYSDDISMAAIASKDLLQLTPEVENNAKFTEELNRYKTLAIEMNKLLSK
ncbi:MAG TPA: hypothetical protein DEF04_00440 [Clostridiales bacterium]|nr:hypothetical protein [Clostridiales bacterium]